MTDHRKYTRLPITVVTELHLEDGEILYGETSDISLDGAFIYLQAREITLFKRGDHCKMALVLTTGNGGFRVSFNIEVMHIQKDGIGIQLDDAEQLQYEDFIKLLLENAQDPSHILEEISAYPGEHFQLKK